MKYIRTTIIVFLLVGLFYSADAQYDDSATTQYLQKQVPYKYNTTESLKSTGYFELGFGFAVPAGNFANTIGGGYTGGYAIPGKTVNLSLGMPIAHSSIGIALKYGYYNNVFDINTYVYNIQESDQAKIYHPIMHDSYTENLIVSGPFWIWQIRHLSVEVHLMAGIASCGLPEILYNAATWGMGYAYNWYYYPTTKMAFAFDAGGGIRYKIHKTYTMLGVNFIHAKPAVNTTLDYSNPLGAARVSPISGYIPISDVSITMGVGYLITGW